ncbi:GNAT family N-acetyltransferase [Winogradskyella immobilis]|uniref:GNAT family N-acetyltransferase n=1 Tax=Winogradskyella immobilis TaxID=2816852 RepID=A0ABS8EPM3_9FLAO|nr:GNAT family N-acetyltransferase [Winogradskyella immobilis]MCC1484826.1 GNAT family N-acetyltransferase [Winogradskyella immobilis]MCG0016918.1 GNAT family N-acetyltransferase [Winogradskyella immobilis]
MISISKDVKLRVITLDDQARLHELMHRIYPPFYRHLWVNEDCNWYMNFCYSMVNLQNELSEPQSEYYFVYYKENLNGILRFKYNSTLEHSFSKNTAYLHRIYLGEESHGKGVAKVLFDWVDKKAKENGQSGIWLEAMDTQIQALKFYEKCNYIIKNTRVLNFERIHEKYRGMIILYKSLI